MTIVEMTEHLEKIDRTCEENPDLPPEFVNGILIGMEDIKAGNVSEFVFRDDK